MLRQLGYVIAGSIVGAENPRITFGSGPRVFKWKLFDVRKHYHLYSWYSYDRLKNQSKAAYVFVYLAPILMNVVFGIVINALMANGVIETYETFWNRFIFYAFYYVLFDVLPMKTVDGKPNNGRLIFEMVKYGKRTDMNKEPFIPSTSGVEEAYQEERKRVEAKLKEMKQDQRSD